MFLRKRYAFKVSQENPNKLIKYDDRLPSPWKETEESTERHKVFNETPGQAYALLFPPLKKEQYGWKKESRGLSPPVSTNRFGVLSNLIEEETGYEVTASQFWQEDDTTVAPKQRSAITEDPIETAVAIHPYVLGLQNFAKTINDIRTSVAKGEIPLVVAGWLTNMARVLLQAWTHKHSSGAGYYEMLMPDYPAKVFVRKVKEDMVAVELLDAARYRASGEQDGFLELTHTCGLRMGWLLSLTNDFLVDITDERFKAHKKDTIRDTIMGLYSPSDLVLRAKDTIMSDFEGPFPLAKVNYFAVMNLTLDIWKSARICYTSTQPLYDAGSQLPVNLTRA